MADMKLIKRKYVKAIQYKNWEKAYSLAWEHKNQFRALVIAISNNATLLGEWLLRVGWDCNEERDRDGCTPLHAAVTVRSSQMVMALLARGANALKPDRYGYTPLESSLKVKMDVRALRVHHTIAAYMLDSEFRGQNGRGETLLHCMSKNKLVPYAIFNNIIKRGVNVNSAENFSGRSFIMDMNIFYPDQYMVIKVLALALQFGLDINYADQYGYTMLHRVASEEKLLTLQWIARLEGVKIRQPNAYKQTPLWIATKRGNVDTFRVLYRMGKSVEGEAAEFFGSDLLKTMAEMAQRKNQKEIVHMVNQEQGWQDGKRIVKPLMQLAKTVIREELAKDGVNIAPKVEKLEIPKALIGFINDI